MADITGTNGPEILVGTEDADTINGLGGDDTLIGLGDDDTLDGGDGEDTLNGGLGNDRYYLTLGDLVVEGAGEGNDIILAGFSFVLADTVFVENLSTRDWLATTPIDITGNAWANTIVGNAGANVLNGGSGADVLQGLGGDDGYYLDDAADRVLEASGGGNDIVLTSVDFRPEDTVFVENLSTRDWLATTPIDITGNAWANTIVGNAGANVLNGGGGADVLQGLGGDDRYYLDDAADRVLEASGGGDDIILTSVDFRLAETVFVENLSTRDWLATTPIDITGNAQANTIVGNAGANVLNGGGGADALQGLGGDDRYYLDNIADRVFEANGGGNDIVLTSVDFRLGEAVFVENLSTRDWAATTPIDITGNAQANTITGNAGANTLDGGGGADALQGFGGDDRYDVDHIADRVLEAAGEGFDVIYTETNYRLAETSHVERLSARDVGSTTPLELRGNGFVNRIDGNDGANFIDGGAGADTMVGFRGDDRYVVDDVNDVVTEAFDQGYDRISTDVSYRLGELMFVEVLTARDLTSTTNINLYGNRHANSLVGNAGNNVLDGGSTDVRGDMMHGLGGDDTYVIRSTRDQVIEAPDEGTDTILFDSTGLLGPGGFSLVNHPDVENLAPVDPSLLPGGTGLTGNARDNRITGSLGGDSITGHGGADVLIGLAGNDTYNSVTLEDQIIEAVGGGVDWITTHLTSYTLPEDSEVEGLRHNSGPHTDRHFEGNQLDNFIEGWLMNDWLDGKGGSDALTGGVGADTFAFTTAPGAGNVDSIADFSTGEGDKIALDDAVFTGLAAGPLPDSAFVSGASALDADDRILHDAATGRVYFDADGNGSGEAILFVTLDAALALTAADFVVV